MYLDSKWTLHREIRRFIKTGMLIKVDSFCPRIFFRLRKVVFVLSIFRTILSLASSWRAASDRKRKIRRLIISETRSISPRDRARSGLVYARLSKLGSGTRPLLVRRKEGLRPIRCHRYNRLYSRGTFAMFIRVSRFYRPDYTGIVTYPERINSYPR